MEHSVSTTRNAAGAALPAIWEGKAKMPLPIIDPTTSAVSAATVRPAFEPAGRVSVGVAVMTNLLEPAGAQFTRQFDRTNSSALQGRFEASPGTAQPVSTGELHQWFWR